MLLMFGQDERVLVVGPAEPRHCPRCDCTTGFMPRLRYRMARVDLLFGWVYSRRYELACPECDHGWLLDTPTMDAQLGGVPIRFRHRFGLPVMLASVAALAGIAWLWRHGYIG